MEGNQDIFRWNKILTLIPLSSTNRPRHIQRQASTISTLNTINSISTNNSISTINSINPLNPINTINTINNRYTHTQASRAMHNPPRQSGSAAPSQGTSGQFFNSGPSPQFMPPGSNSTHADPNLMNVAGRAPQPPQPPQLQPRPTTQYDLPPATAPRIPSFGTGGITSTPEASYRDLTQNRSGQNNFDVPGPLSPQATHEERIKYSDYLNRRSQALLKEGYYVKRRKTFSNTQKTSEPHEPQEPPASQPPAQQPPQPVANTQDGSVQNNFPVPTPSAPLAPVTETLDANSKRHAQDAVDQRPEKRQTSSKPQTPPVPQEPPATQPPAQQPPQPVASASPAAVPDRPESPIPPWDAEPDRLPESELASIRRTTVDLEIEPDPSKALPKSVRQISWSQAMEEIKEFLLLITPGKVFIKFWQFRHLCNAIELFIARNDRRPLTRRELEQLITVRYTDIIETAIMEGHNPAMNLWTARDWESKPPDEMNTIVRLAFKERHRLAFTGGI